jgi:hypothetical protein
MTTQQQQAAYNKALKALDGAVEVKIGKTVYSIEEIKTATDNTAYSVVIRKGNTLKDLIPDTSGGWSLWSGRAGSRRGLPKNVTPEFILGETVVKVDFAKKAKIA